MIRPSFVIATVVAVGLTGGCRGPAPEELPHLIAVEGCLTASDGQLVLTRLTPAGNGPEADRQGTVAPAGAPGALPPQQMTEMFILTGLEDELRPHVGQQVRVRGEATPPEVGVVQQRELPTGPATGDSPRGQPVDPAAEGEEPRVSTMHKTRFATTDLLVRAVTPLNVPCEVPEP
jgi:hypothetical protein